MASQDIVMRLKMVAEGVRENVQSSQTIADNYARAERSAQRMGAPQARRAAAAGAMTTSENIEYGRARGNLGGTGASARDFANQAQGLGGLVRLYATYAANVFAVGAAFRALSDAMNTSNMVRGLDQLGAASGRALGNLSQQLVQATDGAISLRDAMTSVAQTTSAGMSSQNVLRLGVAAQKASQALGLNMPDALSRLSRGITKLEPELLDELGIFVRIDDAAEKYARSLGKTAASLTDFERRQGFALAVLTQAEEKFNKLDLATNPYDKLAASVDNLTKKLLSFINVALTPIAEFFASSPAALGAGILAIGALILKQALPILTMYREGLKKARDASLATAAETSADFQKGAVVAKRLALQKAYAAEDAAVAAADAAEEKLTKIAEAGALNRKKRVQAILKKDPGDLGQADYDYLENQAKRNEKTNATLAKSYRDMIPALQEHATKAVAARKAESDLAAQEQKFNESQKKNLESNIGYRKQLTQFSRDDLAAQTANTAKTVGYYQAVKQGFQTIAQQRKQLAVDVPVIDPKTGKATGETIETITKGLSRAEAGAAGARVVFSALGQAATALVSRLTAIGFAVASLSAAFQLLNTMFSRSQKEAESYAQSQDLVRGALKNVDMTLEAIRAKSPDKILSIDSIQARANAFNDLSDAVLKNSRDFDKLINAQNGWSMAWDGIARFFGKTLGEIGEKVNGVTGLMLRGVSKLSAALFGKGAQAEFADNLSESIVAALAVAESDIERQKLEFALQDILGPLDFNSLDELKKKINALPISELQRNGIEASKAIKRISDEANVSASVLTSLRASIQTVSKDIDALNTSLIPTDRLGKIGVGFIQTSAGLLKGLDDAKNSIVAVKEVLDSPQLLSLFPPEFAQQLIEDKNKINDVVEQLGQARERLRGIKSDLAKLPAQGGDEEQQANRVRLQGYKKNTEDIIKRLEDHAANITTKYGRKMQEIIFEEGVKKLEASLKFSMQRAAIETSKVIVGILGEGGGPTATLERRLTDKELSIQQQLIDAQYQSRLALDRNTAMLEKSNNEQDIRALNEKIAKQPGGMTGEDQRNYQRLMETRQTISEKQKALENPSLANLQKLQQGTEYQKRASTELGTLTSTMYGKQAAEQEILQKSRQAAITEERKKVAENIAQEAKTLDRQKQFIGLDLERVNLQQELLGVYDSSLASQTKFKQEAMAILDSEKEQDAINKNLQYYQKLKTEDAEQEESRLLIIANLEKDLALSKEKYASADGLRRARYVANELRGLEAIAQRERDNAAAQLQATTNISTTKLDSQLEYLSLLGQVDGIDKQALITEQTRINLIKEDLSLQTQLLDIANKQGVLDAKKAEYKRLKPFTGKSATKEAELAREQQLLNAQRDSIIAANEARAKGLKLQAEQNIQLERQNYFLEQATRISDVLNNNFGKTGERLGQAVDGFSKIAINLQKSEKAQKDFNKRSQEMTEDSSAEQWASFWEEKDRLEKKSAQDELDRNAMALSSTKKLFKEKTGAYKAFGALEKAYHVARLIMSAKEIATQIAQTVSFVTSSITRQGMAATEAGVLGVKAVINAISSMPFPLNLAAGAATTALVAGLLAKIGKAFSGGGGGGGFVPTTQQSQEVQGTAMSYDENGKKVQTSRGVFGDTDAKNDAIAKSIAVIEANSVDGLNYDNKVVNLLKSIDASMGGAAKSLYGMTGLRTGTSAGFSLPGTRINENWIGIDTKKISMDVREAGLYLKGSIEDIRNNIVNSVMTYQAGIRKVDFPSWRFWSKDYEEAFKEVKRLGDAGGPQQELLDYVQQVILGGEQALIELGKELGKTGVEALLSGVTFDANINIKDLKGDDLAKEVSAVLGAQIDKMTIAVFGEYARFAEFNETLTETVIRVFDSNRKVIQSLKNVGISSADLLKDFDGQVITELLVGLSDGLEGFLGKVEKFRDVFLTDSEKITPTVTSLKTRLQELGFTNVDTATEFKLLVQSIKPVTAESAKLLDALLDLAPAVEQTYKAIEDMLEGLRVETISLTSTLTPNEIILRDITIKTAEYVEKLKAAGLATEANVKIVANWSKASALTQLRNNLKSAYEERKRELESNIAALKKFKDVLVDLKNSLLIGDLSVLTPLEQYNELLSQYETSLINLRSTDSAVAEAARASFPQLAKQLLESGRTIYSSSEAFTKLSTKVNSDIQSAGDFIDEQLTTEESTLKTLNDTYTSILGIETATKSTVDKLTEIAALYNQVAGADTTQLAKDIVTALSGGKSPVEAIAQALNAQIPIVTKATAEAVVTVLGNKTVDTVLTDAVSKVITDADAKAKKLEEAGAAAASTVKKSGEDVIDKIDTSITKLDDSATKLTGAATAAVSTLGTAGGALLTTINTGVTALTAAQQAAIAAVSGDQDTGSGAAIDGDNAALRAATNGTSNLNGDYSHIVVAADGTLIDPAGLVLAGTADSGTLVSIDGNGTLVGKVDTSVPKSTEVEGDDTGLSVDTIITAMEGDGEGRGDTTISTSLSDLTGGLTDLSTAIEGTLGGLDVLGEGAGANYLGNSGYSVIDTGNAALSDASILQSATDLASTIASDSNPGDAALLTAYAMQDITEARNNALIGLAPGLVDGALNAADTVVSVVTAVVGALSDAVENVTDTVGEMGSSFIDATSSRSIGSSDISPWIAGGLSGPGSLFSGGEIGGGGNFSGGWRADDGMLDQMSNKADGGPVMRNSPYVVGENGPELFVPKTNGTIISNPQLKNYTSAEGDEVSNAEVVAAINRLTQVVAQSNIDNAKTIINGWSKNKWEQKLSG